MNIIKRNFGPICRGKGENEVKEIRKKYFQKYCVGTTRDKRNIVYDLNITVCPYCNRIYISCFGDVWKEDEKRSSANIDHFLSNSNFVLFSLSLYNFIPSCSVCNTLFKLDKNMDILYPYVDAYENEAKFTLINNEEILAYINAGLADEEKLKAQEFDKFFYGIDVKNITEEWKKEPLAKLTHDIMK